MPSVIVVAIVLIVPAVAIVIKSMVVVAVVVVIMITMIAMPLKRKRGGDARFKIAQKSRFPPAGDLFSPPTEKHKNRFVRKMSPCSK